MSGKTIRAAQSRDLARSWARVVNCGADRPRPGSRTTSGNWPSAAGASSWVWAPIRSSGPAKNPCWRGFVQGPGAYGAVAEAPDTTATPRAPVAVRAAGRAGPHRSTAVAPVRPGTTRWARAAFADRPGRRRRPARTGRRDDHEHDRPQHHLTRSPPGPHWTHGRYPLAPKVPADPDDARGRHGEHQQHNERTRDRDGLHHGQHVLDRGERATAPDQLSTRAEPADGRRVRGPGDPGQQPTRADGDVPEGGPVVGHQGDPDNRWAARPAPMRAIRSRARNATVPPD